MKFHNNLKYSDIKKADTIIISADLLKTIEQYFILNQVANSIDFKFKTLNIELFFDKKINIYIENYDKERAIITFFINNKKIFSFVMEYILDIAFEVKYIFEYEEIVNCERSVEEYILFVLNWYPKILFYIQSYSARSNSNFKKCTFFVNVDNYMLGL